MKNKNKKNIEQLENKYLKLLKMYNDSEKIKEKIKNYNSLMMTKKEINKKKYDDNSKLVYDEDKNYKQLRVVKNIYNVNDSLQIKI